MKVFAVNFDGGHYKLTNNHFNPTGGFFAASSEKAAKQFGVNLNVNWSRYVGATPADALERAPKRRGGMSC